MYRVHQTASAQFGQAAAVVAVAVVAAAVDYARRVGLVMARYY